MSLPLIIYALVFLAGFLTKLTDNLIDEPNTLNSSIKYVTGLAYGLLVGYLLSIDPAVSTVIAAIIIGNLFFGRIDHRAHTLSFAGIIIMVILFGIAQVNPAFLIILAVFAWIDEFLNEKADKNRFSKKVNWFARKRMIFEIAALGASLYTLNPVYFISIILFDLSYILADKSMKKAGIVQKA